MIKPQQLVFIQHILIFFFYEKCFWYMRNIPLLHVYIYEKFCVNSRKFRVNSRKLRFIRESFELILESYALIREKYYFSLRKWAQQDFVINKLGTVAWEKRIQTLKIRVPNVWLLSLVYFIKQRQRLCT